MRSKFLGHSANDLFWFILPLVLPTLLVRYDLSYAQAGVILTIYLTVTAVGSFVVGKLSDRYSRKGILAYGLLLASVGLGASGFAPTLPLFLLLISVTAVGVSTFHPVMYAVLDEHYPENKGRVMSWYETSGTTAILIMFLVNGYLLQKIGVRGVLLVTAVPALVMGFHYLNSQAIPESGRDNSRGREEGEPASRQDLVRFVLFLASVILRVISLGAVLNFLPTILVDFLHFDSSTASYATAFYFCGGIGGSLYAGKISGRFNPFLVLALGTLLIIPSVLALTLPLPGWGYLAAIASFGFVGSGCLINQNLMMTSMGKHLGKGEAFGVMMGVLTLTAAFSPALLGLAIDHWGFYHAIYAFTLPLFLGAGILVVLLKSARSGYRIA